MNFKINGAQRKLDSLNRLVIPIQICRSLNLKHGDMISVWANDEAITLTSREKLPPGFRNGLLRKMDSLHRVVIPKELRNVFHIGMGSLIHFSVEGDTILLRPSPYNCCSCGNTRRLIQFHNDERRICTPCGEKVVAAMKGI